MKTMPLLFVSTLGALPLFAQYTEYSPGNFHAPIISNTGDPNHRFPSASSSNNPWQTATEGLAKISQQSFEQARRNQQELDRMREENAARRAERMIWERNENARSEREKAEQSQAQFGSQSSAPPAAAGATVGPSTQSFSIQLSPGRETASSGNVNQSPPRPSAAELRQQEELQQQRDLKRWQDKMEAKADASLEAALKKGKKGNIWGDDPPKGGKQSSSGDWQSDSSADLEERAMRQQRADEWKKASNNIWNHGKKDPWGDFRSALDAYEKSDEALADKTLNRPASASPRPTILPDGSPSTLQEKTRRDDNDWLNAIGSPHGK
jgi:hypothetical protein